MINTIDRIHQSNTPPKQTNVIWDDNGVLKIYRNGDWEPLCVSEGAIKEILDKIKGIENTLQSGLLTSYLHTAYANSADGKKDFSIVDSSDREYLGLYSDFNITPSKNPSDYKWTKIKGEQGEKGDQGINGTNGVDGAVGTNTYFHIKYSNSPDGIPLNDFEGAYMGTYVDEILEDSEDASKYTWVKIKGENGVDGEQGIPGLNGADGKTSYLHIAYANSPDGSEGFSVTDSEDKIYVGQYVDFEQYDSYDYTKYKWTRMQGVKGDAGIRYYTWLRYADTIEFDSEGKPIGGTGMDNSPTNADGTFKPYMGLAYDQVVPDESDNYADYKWTKIQGEKGIDGVNGYTWIVYADKLPETSDDIYQYPTEKTEYIGIAPNKNTEDESENPAVYKWSKFKGDQGIQGEKGKDGNDGKSYEYIYRRTKDENDVPNINGLPSEQVDEYTPSGWEDNAQGVSSEYRAEWCCTRIKVEGKWGGWRGPSLWSTYGKEGKDGGDIQYVYKRTATETAPDNPTPQDYLNSDHYQEKGEYLNKEFVPIGWSDEPQGVNEYNPFEWTCVRKKVDGKWQDYKGPSLWAKYGKDGKDGTSIRIKGYVETIYDLPSIPEDANDCYVVGNNLFIWDKTYWKDAGPFKGENGANGISIEWKGQLSSHPQNPEEGWAYKNSNGISYIFRNGTWNIMVTDGEASCVLELSNDADSVNCDYDGNIVDPNKPSCTASLYKGTNKIDSGVTFEVRFSDSKAKGITIDGNGNLVFSDGYSFYDNVLRVSIYATYGNSTLSKTFTLSKNIPGSPGEDATKWFLKASSSIVVMDKQEVLTPSKIRINCYKQIGSKDPVEDKNTTIYWDYDTDTPTIGINSGAEIYLKKDFSYITFALKNADDKFYEIEKVPLVKDGKDGDAGRSIAVKGTFESEAALKAKYPNGPDDYSDCYIVGTDLYVWDGLEWNNVGQFKGEDGKSSFLHVAFANSEDGTKDFSTTDDSGRKYMGQYVDSIEDDSNLPDRYSWKKYVGAGINSTTVTYGISPNMTDEPTTWYNTIPQVPKGNYLWTKTFTDYTDPDMEDTTVYTYSYQPRDGQDGKNGVAGKQGKTVYPAGKWDTSVTYTSTEYTTPYVIHNDEYWQLAVDSSKGIEPSPSNSDWIKFDKFEAIFAKVGMIDNGTFGAAVFSGNYMFSQYGKTTKGGDVSTNEYQYFRGDLSDPYSKGGVFYPNVCIDFYNGKAWFGAGDVFVSGEKFNISDILEYEETINPYGDGSKYKSITFNAKPIESADYNQGSIELSSKGVRGSLETFHLTYTADNQTKTEQGTYKHLAIFPPQSNASNLILNYTYNRYEPQSLKLLTLSVFKFANYSRQLYVNIYNAPRGVKYQFRITSNATKDVIQQYSFYFIETTPFSNSYILMVDDYTGTTQTGYKLSI